jgi:hypothetical protein
MAPLQHLLHGAVEALSCAAAVLEPLSPERGAFSSTATCE